MNALDLLDDSYPHGTVEGYDQGCRTNHCPAPITCTIFRTRYVGDWAFRRMVDGGMTAADIVARETEEAAAAKAAAKAKRRAEVSADYQRWSQIELDELRRLHAKGVRFSAIAKAIGRSEWSVKRAATSLNLPRRMPAKVTTKAGTTRRAWTDTDVTRLRDLHEQGLNDREVGEQISRSSQAVWEKRKQLGLGANLRTAADFEHGTLTGYAKFHCHGDDCPATPSCGDIGRDYYRQQWVKRQARKGPKPRQKRTVCKRNHELTEENTIWKDGGTRRNCRTCTEAVYQERRDARAAGLTIAEYRAQKENAA